MIRARATRELMPHWLHSQHGDKFFAVDDCVLFQSADDRETVWEMTGPDRVANMEEARARLGLASNV